MSLYCIFRLGSLQKSTLYLIFLIGFYEIVKIKIDEAVIYLILCFYSLFFNKKYKTFFIFNNKFDKNNK